MEVSEASSINISHSYSNSQGETVKEGAVSATINEASTVLRNILDHVSRQSSIDITYPDEQQQRWNARYLASQGIASDMERFLACEPDLCVIYYTATSKPVGLMILDKKGELDGYKISGMITDFTEKGIGKKLTEYAVNTSYNEGCYDGEIYLKTSFQGSQDIFRSRGFKDKGDGFLFLNPHESDHWEFGDNKWSLNSVCSPDYSVIDGEEKPGFDSNKSELLTKDHQMRKKLLMSKEIHSEPIFKKRI